MLCESELWENFLIQERFVDELFVTQAFVVSRKAFEILESRLVKLAQAVYILEAVGSLLGQFAANENESSLFYLFKINVAGITRTLGNILRRNKFQSVENKIAVESYSKVVSSVQVHIWKDNQCFRRVCSIQQTDQNNYQVYRADSRQRNAVSFLIDFVDCKGLKQLQRKKKHMINGDSCYEIYPPNVDL